ncbi:hypothetical protein [Aliarcobacter butzleri]|uniref:hypothetical protein n=1 Tax=Aliarcobacter butzleri TaxID=28197 RepID=UPI002B250661|nr:hypothetical protein [Aliarcobacter butzleri]
MRKKAFSLLEIVFSIIIGTLIFYFLANDYREKKWYDGVEDFKKDIYTIIDKGVINNVTGYINSSGGDCSNSPHYNDISAAKVIGCNRWENSYPFQGTKNDNGEDSYIYGFLKNYSNSNLGCKLYINDKDSVSFYVFIDCSSINFSNELRSKQFLEESLSSFIKKSFSIIYQEINRESTTISNDTGGTQNDGMLRFLIKK